MVEKRKPARGLGRGLSALMADVAVDHTQNSSETSRRAEQFIPIERIHPNPLQPRRSFNDDALAELASSIREKGIIQPLIVRPAPDGGGGFEIVAGERRWRASQIVQLHELPVIIRNFNDTEVLEVAIIENIQRADLNAVDEAAGYKQLMDRFGHTQEHLASALGKSRSHIANLLRLLTLPDAIQTYLIEGKLTAGHARALIGHPDAIALAGQIIQSKLSVREAEKLVKKIEQRAPTLRTRSGKTAKDADTLQIEKELSAQLHMKVQIDHKSSHEGGRLSIDYNSLDQLDDLMRALSGG